MTAIEFTPTEERILAYYFGAKVRDGRFPRAKDAAAALNTTPGAIRTMLSKLRKKGIRVGAPVGLHGPKPEADGLTDKQRSILRWMADYRDRNGIMPTIREVGEAFGFASSNASICHLRALLKKGWLRQVKANGARSYVLAKEVAA